MAGCVGGSPHRGTVIACRCAAHLLHAVQRGPSNAGGSTLRASLLRYDLIETACH